MTKTYIYQGFSMSYTMQGAGPCVVLLHGFCENKTIWEPFIFSLQERHTIINIDLPGHGKSAVVGPVHSMDECAQIVKEILVSENIETACIIGHSMGGYVGIAFAALFPGAVKGLCLFHSTAYADSEEKKKDRARAMEVVMKNKGAYVNALIPGIFNPDNLQAMQQQVSLLTEIGLQTPAEGIVAALAGMSTRPDRMHVLKEVDFPISFIIGKRDGILPLEKLMELTSIPKQAQVLILENVGHAGFVEAPKECMLAMEHLVKSVSSF